LKNTIADNKRFTKPPIAKMPNWRYFFEILAKLGLKWAWKLRVVWLMDSKSLRETAHPVGEVKNERFSHDKVSAGASALPVDTGGGRYHVQWDDSAPVTPLGQLVFFAQFLHAGG
jgi:hypothetical protein